MNTVRRIYIVEVEERSGASNMCTKIGMAMTTLKEVNDCSVAVIQSTSPELPSLHRGRLHDVAIDGKSYKASME